MGSLGGHESRLPAGRQGHGHAMRFWRFYAVHKRIERVD